MNNVSEAFTLGPTPSAPDFRLNVVNFRSSSCKLSLSTSQQIADRLLRSPQLESLSLHSSASLAAAFSSNLQPLRGLRCLELSSCRMSKNQSLVLCHQVRYLPALEVLKILQNSIGSRGAQALANSIRSWGSESSLGELRLDDCEIDQAGCVPLLEALTSCSKLYHLSLNSNLMEGSFLALKHNLNYPKLLKLEIGTSLIEGDIQKLAAVVNNNGMPQLKALFIDYKMEENLKSWWDKLCLGFPFTGKNLVEKVLMAQSDDTVKAWGLLLDKAPAILVGRRGVKIHPKILKEKVEAELVRRSMQ